MLRDNNKKRRIVVVGKGGGGGIDQVQSDWNQTDNTQVDYIKNKPSVYNEWFGTQVEYDAISVKDPNTIYYIEDASGSVVRDGKTYGIKVHITDPELEDLSVTANGTYQSSTKYGYDEVTVNVPSVVYPTYLTATYFVPNPTNSFKILGTTTNIAGYRIKGASTWETPATTIAVSDYGELVIEYDLTDNTTLEGNQFRACTDLVKIEFPTSITTIGDECFRDAGLIDYPDMTYVATTGERLFFNCRIKSIGLTINDNVTRNYANGVFNGFDYTDVIDKVYVNGKVYIALFHTENNGDVDLTNGIDGLPFDTWCMYGGHMHYTLNSLKFPSTLQYLSGLAFNSCTITDLYFYGTTPPQAIPFQSGDSDDIWSGSNITNIYVPAASLTAYQNSPAFADVASIIQGM